MTEKTIEERGVLAAKAFLERKGYEILGELEGPAQFVAEDPEEGTIVFVAVETKDIGTTEFPDERASMPEREVFEKAAIQWLATQDRVDRSIRFDYISIVVVSEGRAMLRHHHHAL